MSTLSSIRNKYDGCTQLDFEKLDRHTAPEPSLRGNAGSRQRLIATHNSETKGGSVYGNYLTRF